MYRIIFYRYQRALSSGNVFCIITKLSGSLAQPREPLSNAGIRPFLICIFSRPSMNGALFLPYPNLNIFQPQISNHKNPLSKSRALSLFRPYHIASSFCRPCFRSKPLYPFITYSSYLCIFLFAIK